MTDIIYAELTYINKNILSDIQIRQIKNKLTVRSVFENSRTIPVYSEDGEYLGVPRYFRLPFSTDGYSVVNYEAGGSSVGFKFRGTLRPNQDSALKKYQKYLDQGITGVLLNAQTGAGKTVMAIRFLEELGLTTLIIVPKSDLMDQWRDRILQFTNLTKDDIGYAQQNTCNYQGKKVVIGMLQSLCKDKYPEEFKQYFGCLVADECHRLSANEFSKAMKLFPAKYRLGLSASMERTDGTSVVFYLHLSSNTINVKPSQPKPEIYVYNYGGFSGAIPRYLKQVQQRRGVLLTMLAENKDRTRALSILTDRLARSGRQTVVLSERKAMLKEMQNYLVETKQYRRRDVGIYVSETTKKEKSRIALECKIILATTRMLSEGTDINSLRAIIFASPMSQVLQPVGRIRRSGKGYKTPIVVDFVDIRYPSCMRWAGARKRWYVKEGFSIKTM